MSKALKNKVKLNGIINVKAFGATGDAVTDDTVAIQAALNEAKVTRQSVYIPAGKYIISQLAFPSGIEVYGDGVGGYGSIYGGYPYDATLLWQKGGVNDDAIVFDCPLDGSNWRLFHSYIHDFVLGKSASSPLDTLGNGISARQVGLDRTLDSSHCLVNGITVFERILVRGFPENGMYFKRGAVPLYCNELDFIFNKGYGLRLDGTNYSRNIVFRNIAGDGNVAGATVYIAGPGSDSQVTLDGIYGEYRSDGPSGYGMTTGFTGAQPRAIEIGNFGSNSAVYIANVLQDSIVTDEAAECCIYVNAASISQTPRITYNTCVISDLTATTGGKYVLKNALTSETIPPLMHSGNYNINVVPGGYNTQYMPELVSFGKGFVRPAIQDSGSQAYGALPAHTWYETDAGTNEKGWVLGSSGGSLYLRTFSDDGSATNIAMTITRSGNAATQIQFQKLVGFYGGVDMPVYADNAAALAGGLVAKMLYKTSAGDVRVVV